MNVAGLLRARRHGRAIFAGLAVAVAVSGCALFGEIEPTPADFPVHGIDVSRYQGTVDWDAARRGGVAFAWIKATEGGDRVDDGFAYNWEAARAAGVPRGAYHFFYFCRPVEEQIGWFFASVPVDPAALPPVLDIEWTPGSKTCRVRPPRSVLLPEIRTFLTALQQHYRKRPILYTTVDFYRDVIRGALTDYPLWVRSTAGYPSERYGERPWAFWQYTATGHVPGVAGRVDRNVFAGTINEWRKFVAGG
jgi:lysozyme